MKYSKTINAIDLFENSEWEIIKIKDVGRDLCKVAAINKSTEEHFSDFFSYVYLRRLCEKYNKETLMNL